MKVRTTFAGAIALAGIAFLAGCSDTRPPYFNQEPEYSDPVFQKRPDYLDRKPDYAWQDSSEPPKKQPDATP